MWIIGEMRTSMRLFSLAVVSKSLSRIPFTTLSHEVPLSHSPCSSTGRTVTFFLGPVTFVETAPALRPLLFVFYCPLKLLAWNIEPEPIGGLRSTLKVCDLPEK